MHIESTRFGTLEIDDESVLEFPDGLIGLPGTGYTLVSPGEDSPFIWLHSTEHPNVAVPLTTPWLFFTDYEVRVPDEDARRLQLGRPEEAHILCVVRAAAELGDFTINLAGPIVLHKEQRLGRQIINNAGGYSVRQPLFSEVQLSDIEPGTPSALVQAAAV